jgi:site-specific recombinase
MIEQCRDVVLKIRRATKRIGVSLTYLISLLEQCLDRVELLLNLIVEEGEAHYEAVSLLLVDITLRFIVNGVYALY